jgi:protein-L-isoaspartate(D-aspartate) O-methyltransferase
MEMMDRSVSAAVLRHRLVQVLEEAGVLETTAIARAFRSVPRELFLPRVAAEKGLEAVYRDEAIPTKFDAAGSAVSSSSQPTVMAAMLSRLELQPGLRVLEVGAGTGYNAALLSTIVGPSGSVTSVDIDAVVARHARGALRSGGYPVRVVTGDGRDGVRTYAPYDRIIVTASSDRLPAAWVEQLREGGLLEVPLRIPSLIETQFIPTLRKTGGELATVAVIPGGFIPLRGLADSSTPALRHPLLAASDHTRAGPQAPLKAIAGQALASLSTARKRRLLRVALSDGQRRPLRVRASTESLTLYLALTLPPARAVRVMPGWGVGLISRDGSGLAYVPSQPRRGTSLTTALMMHGDQAPADELQAAVEEWDRHGRPGAADLEFGVSQNPNTPLRIRWKPTPSARHARTR